MCGYDLTNTDESGLAEIESFHTDRVTALKTYESGSPEEAAEVAELVEFHEAQVGRARAALALGASAPSEESTGAEAVLTVTI